MKALTIRQPWCWAILEASKNIENRDWLTCYRGPLLIHAAAGMTREELRAGAAFIAARTVGLRMSLRDLPRGGFVGVADLTECVVESASPWFVGPYGFVIRNVRPLPFVPAKGRLGLWTPDAATAERLRAAGYTEPNATLVPVEVQP